MIWFPKKIITLFLVASSVAVGEEKINKNQICYLMQAREVQKSVNLYLNYSGAIGKHDFEILQQMAQIVLQEGARSGDKERQLLSIYGCAIGGVAASLDVLDAGITSEHLEAEIAAIQFLGKVQDDRSDELLIKAMSSPFFQARLEAAFQLSLRKHRQAVGHIEALMHRVPPFVRFMFPQFFALIGTGEAIGILQRLIEDPNEAVRVEAILNVAKFGRDDLLPLIRACVTHLNLAEKEACCVALGTFKDLKSLEKLKRLQNSTSMEVRLAASKALYDLGDRSASELIIEMAKGKNLYAVGLLAEIEEGKELLVGLLNDEDLQVRFNVALSLLEHRDPRAIGPILEVLISDERDLGFIPQVSPGKALFFWKIISSVKQKQKNLFFNVEAISAQFREFLIKHLLILPEELFLEAARKIFIENCNNLIPSLIGCLENLRTEKSIGLLRKYAWDGSSPFVRIYCNLALFRLNQEGPYQKIILEWIEKNKDDEIIRLKPIVTIDQRTENSPWALSPENSSRLLVEAYEALAKKQDNNAINLLLQSLKDGNGYNRYVLAGLLLRTIQ
ncbi:MAG: hypothetical protein L0207_03465 [Chlamydiae bacterium]|nr:hypothetical protein [Chlamydiota bacterium]